MESVGSLRNTFRKSSILLAILLPVICLAQADDEPFKITTRDINRIEHEYLVAGSPYLDQEFKLGQWFLYGKKQKELAMRFDAYHDAVQFLQDDQKVFLSKSKDIEAHIDGKTYQYIDYLDHGNLKAGYFIRLNDGETLLYLRTIKTIKGPIDPENGYTQFKPPKFETNVSYYIKPKGKPAMPLLGLSRKEVFAVLWDKYSELRTYAREHKFQVRDEAETVMLLAYYDQLKADEREGTDAIKNN